MMRLRALRLAEVGRFSAPIAVEGFGDGLNVLSGPNELGKSTLLKALDALFKYTYKQLNDPLRELKPNNGGAPLVEAEFESDGRLWRLRKQFLSGASASLIDVAAGTVFKNADAETRLAEIKTAALDFDRFGLLWVRQGDFSAPTDDKGSIGAYVASEVEAISLDARARAIHAKLRKDLFELQTEKTAKPKGAWLAATQAAKAALLRLEAAEASAAKQTKRLEELAELSADRARLKAPDAVAERADRLDAASKRLAKAEDTRQQRDAAAKILADAIKALQAVERDHKSLCEQIAQLQRLTDESTSAQAAGLELQRRAASADAAVVHGHADLARESNAIAALEQELDRATLAAQAHQAEIERDKLSERIADVRAALAAADRARTDAAMLADVTTARVKTLHTAHAELASLAAALAAVVPEVSIALEPDGAGRVIVDGTAMAASAIFHPETPLVIEIAGVGRITIAPNPATVSAEQRALREARRGELETAYALLGATTPADADARLAARQQAETTAREADIRVQVLAPHGLDALITTHAELSARAATAIAGFDIAILPTLQTRLLAQRKSCEAAQAVLQTAQHALNACAVDIATHQSEAAHRSARMAELEAKLGDAAALKAASAASSDLLAVARTSYQTAKSASDAWATAPDADRVEELADALAATERAIKADDERRIALDQAIFGLEQAMLAVGDDDIEGELATARAAAATASARLADTEAEVKAMTLLDREFQAITDAGRRDLSGPILQRIAPYLRQLFPDAALELGDRFIPARLLRDGNSEAHDQLSRGTQEQIAILVRLGLAHLLADRGAAVPLILDDALVFADDARIAQMFKALQDGARLHQVIVLNCREQTFGALARAPGTTVLRLEPWAQSARAHASAA